MHTPAKPGSIEEDLNRLFAPEWLRETARNTGFVERHRRIDPVLMFWVVVLGFGVRMQSVLAGLHRSYDRYAPPGNEVNRGSFYKRFDDRLVVFLKACVRHAMQEQAATAGRTLGARLERFNDVLIQDSSVIRLHEKLAKQFPATRTTKVAAGIKLNLLVSAVSDGAKRILLTGERTSESKLLKIGPWVKDRILLIDLGYYKHQAFARIQENGGFFVSRLKGNANPTIVSLTKKVRGNSINVEGQRIQDVLGRLKRGVLDCIVEVDFQRRAYNGKSRGDSMQLRVVAMLNKESGEYHAYITNILPDVLDAEDIAQLYTVRWDIELVFKELKSHYALQQVNTQDPKIVEALIWVALLTLFVSRRVYTRMLERVPPDQYARYTRLRWTKIFAENAELLRNRVLSCAGIESNILDIADVYSIQGLDPNVERERMKDVLW